MPSPHPGDYASFGRRVGAYLIDAIPPVLIYIVGGATLLAAITGRSRGGVSFAVILFLALPIAYFIVLWAMAAKGSSPGKALLGIRVVRESNGRVPGAGLGLGRLLLMGLMIGITLYIGGFSPLWDKSGRRKGWWDSAAGTVVLNLSAVRGYRSMVGVPSETADANVIPPTSPESPVSPGSLQDAPRGAGDVPEWELLPAKAPSMSTKAPAATWSDRPADPRPSGPQVPPPAAPAGSASTGRSMSTADVPWRSSSPVGSALISTIPGLQPTGAQDDLEHTRMAQGKAVGHSAPEWELQFDDGRSVALTGSLIIGRDPAAGADEPEAGLLSMGDEGRSISKTHLRLDASPGGVHVTDRHSTNGVTVITAGIPLACVPGVQTVVPADSTVRFGDRHLLLRRV